MDLAMQFQERGIEIGKKRGIKIGEKRGIKIGESRGEIKGVIETLRDFNKLSKTEISSIIQNKFNLSSEEASEEVEKYL